MADDSWPSPAHNSGAVTEPEYESLVVPYTASGVYGATSDTAVVYADASGRQVKVRANKYAIVRGFFWTSGTTETTIAIAANSSGSTRTDLVVLRLDRAAWTVRVVVKAGTPGAGAPALTQTFGASGHYEIALAVVTVTNGSVSISAGQCVNVAMYLEQPAVVPVHASYQPQSADGMRRFWQGRKEVYRNSGWRPESGWQYVALDADHVIASGTTKQSTALSLAMEPNSVYKVDGVLFYSGGSIGDFAPDLSLPAGATFKYNPQSADAGASSNISSVYTGVMYGTQNAVGGVNGGTIADARTMLLSGTIRTGGTAGNAVVRFGQNVNDPGTATTLWADSHFGLFKIA